LIRSVVSPLGAIENLRENAPSWENAYNLVVCPPKRPKFWQFWVCIPTLPPRQTWNLVRGADLRAKFHVYQGNVSPLRGKETIFGPLSNNNTGMAALGAGLLVIK